MVIVCFFAIVWKISNCFLIVWFFGNATLIVFSMARDRKLHSASNKRQHFSVELKFPDNHGQMPEESLWQPWPEAGRITLTTMARGQKVHHQESDDHQLPSSAGHQPLFLFHGGEPRFWSLSPGCHARRLSRDHWSLSGLFRCGSASL